MYDYTRACRNCDDAGYNIHVSHTHIHTHTHTHTRARARAHTQSTRAFRPLANLDTSVCAFLPSSSGIVPCVAEGFDCADSLQKKHSNIATIKVTLIRRINNKLFIVVATIK